MLTAEHRNALAQPFEANEIEWRVMSNPREGKRMAHIAPYVTARAVMNRLDQVSGDWGTELGEMTMLPGALTVRCTLTVNGTTRSDYGSIRFAEGDDRAAEAPKGTASIALRRVAVQFGIGRYLYQWPKVFATVEALGRGFVLSDEAERELFTLTERLSNNQPLPRFQHLFVPGYAPHMQQQEPAAPAQAAPAPAPKATAPAARPDAPAQAAPKSGPKGVTEPQKGFITQLVAKHRKSDDSKLRALSTQFDIDLLTVPLDYSRLTAHRASALIEALQAPQKKAQAA